MFDKLESIAARYNELNGLLSDPAVLANPDSLRTYAKEQADLRLIVTAYQEYCQARDELQDNQELLQGEALDDEFAALVGEEIATLTQRPEFVGELFFGEGRWRKDGRHGVGGSGGDEIDSVSIAADRLVRDQEVVVELDVHLGLHAVRIRMIDTDLCLGGNRRVAGIDRPLRSR